MPTHNIATYNHNNTPNVKPTLSGGYAVRSCVVMQLVFWLLPEVLESSHELLHRNRLARVPPQDVSQSIRLVSDGHGLLKDCKDLCQHINELVEDLI